MAEGTSEKATMAEKNNSLIKTTFPVLLPEMPQLRLEKDDFDAHIKTLLPPATTTLPIRGKEGVSSAMSDAENASTLQATATASDPSTVEKEKDAPFMTGLLSDKFNVASLDSQDGKMLTENADVAHQTSGQALVDLFFELEDVISATRLKETLEKAWKDDADATLKIIWNSRSIHLGKSSRKTFYRAVGWLAEEHPLTLVTNLPWLVRPLIEKKAPKKDEKKEGGGNKKDEPEVIEAKDLDSDFEMVEGDEGDEGNEELPGQPQSKKLKLGEDSEVSKFDIKYGVSHGYWKDLLNILALATNNQLKVDGDPKTVLNVSKTESKPYRRDWTPGHKKAMNTERHDRVIEKLKNDKFYEALHLTVARLFAEQLKTDLARLQSEHKADVKRITLVGKWAPTHKGMHDQHTCIVSSIAELLHPFDSACPDGVDPGDRELYLKYARIAYQSQTLSPLRKHLQIVERDITSENFAAIKYERVPSLAMQQYTPLFAKKDFEHFDSYIENVASGKKSISGAVLLPSTLVATVNQSPYLSSKGRGADAMVEQKLQDIRVRTVDAQWNTLVKRIKASGTLESSIAVCDVSGSMSSPRFADGTCPMSSSVGLSLLLAEVVEPPFGGAIITFSERPQVVRVAGKDDKRTFKEKVSHIMRSDWGGSTNFGSVFEKLILPMALEHKLAREDMVKQVFVFSDMQFNSADNGHHNRWSTSYERIKEKFVAAGYDMPRLIFWNLAGGRAGFGDNSLSSSGAGSDVAPKPVTAMEEGTALVSGYSQGMLKVFLDSASFDEPAEEGDEDDEEEEVGEEEGDGDEVVVEKKVKEKKKKDPLAVVKKAIGHPAYRMLRVVD